mgnify:FL=1
MIVKVSSNAVRNAVPALSKVSGSFKVNSIAQYVLASAAGNGVVTLRAIGADCYAFVDLECETIEEGDGLIPVLPLSAIMSSRKTGTLSIEAGDDRKTKLELEDTKISAQVPSAKEFPELKGDVQEIGTVDAAQLYDALRMAATISAKDFDRCGVRLEKSQNGVLSVVATDGRCMVARNIPITDWKAENTSYTVPSAVYGMAMECKWSGNVTLCDYQGALMFRGEMGEVAIAHRELATSFPKWRGVLSRIVSARENAAIVECDQASLKELMRIASLLVDRETERMKLDAENGKLHIELSNADGVTTEMVNEFSGSGKGRVFLGAKLLATFVKTLDKDSSVTLAISGEDTAFSIYDAEKKEEGWVYIQMPLAVNKS